MILKLFKSRVIKLLVILLVVLLLYLFPSKKEYKLNTKEVLNENKYHEIFLIDKNNMLAKTKIVVNSIEKDELAKELLGILIIDGEYNDRIPNGFRAILPEDTRLNSLKIEDDIVNVDFNNKVFDSINYSDEKILESIIYTLTSIKGIKGINILIDSKPLERLPKSNKIIDSVLTRDFGINKEYDINSIKNITNVTIYYNNKFNENVYYVPVTKYFNNNEENKIKIIIEELTGRMSYNSNLISYLNSKTELLNYSFNEEELDLNFNEYLFDNKEEQKVLEEVIYSISYSMEDTLKVSNISFSVNNKNVFLYK